jgi:BioD-like phosphotransacetylase family protein
MAKAIYVAATGQHSGKTVVSLGLIAAFAKRGISVGYMKPVGQRTVEVDGVVVDEDVHLIAQVYGAGASAAEAGPVTVPPRFTQEFIDSDGEPAPLIAKIERGFAAVTSTRDVVVVEGTGHAGVGAVIELSNASVARILHADALIITGGGIGKPIDEFALNRALFDQEGVRVLGAVANKVVEDKLDKIRSYVARSLAAHGSTLLGCIPHRTPLTEITVRQIVRELDAEVLSGEDDLGVHIHRAIIGATSAHRLIEFFGSGVLVIAPGDRDDIVLAALSSGAPGHGSAYAVSALCLTSDILPHENILRLVRRSQVPVIAVKTGTFETASSVHDLVAKTTPDETQKIRLATVLVEKYVDVDRLIDLCGIPVRGRDSAGRAAGSASH